MKAAAREIAIRIGERDRLIDKEAANELRENLRADPLPEVPYAIPTDHGAALASARAKCPRRESLPVEAQLAFLEEDREHELRERPKRHAARQEAIRRGNLVGMPREALADRLYEWRVRQLRAKG